MRLHVDSEVGTLRQVILHSPELSLKRLTPSNKNEFLFDDVLWVQRAVEEHQEWQQVLRDRGITVHLLSDLLRTTVGILEARKHILDRSVDERFFGPMAADAVRNTLDGLDTATLARFLTGGITKREIMELGCDPRSLAFRVLEMNDFVLPPLPNHLFTRDTSCWIYDGVSINAMRKKARRHETVNYEAIYRHHPMFASGYDRPDEGGYNVWMAGTPSAPATVEGGDVLVLGGGVVLVGI
ncbi:arginine deiminase family protein, partial [Streptosporangium longisporum]